MPKSVSILRSPVSSLTGVGSVMAKKLERIGISYTYQLLFRLPTRYIDYSETVDLTEAVMRDNACVKVEITKISSRRSWKRRGLTVTTAEVADETGTATIFWFNRSYITDKYAIGDLVYLAGNVTKKKDSLQMANPDIELARNKEASATATLIPIYKTTKGISQKQWRLFLQQAIEALRNEPDELPEWLDAEIQERYDIINYPTALQYIHFPTSNDELQLAKRRFGFDEILLGQLFVQSSKHELAKNTAPIISWNESTLRNRLHQLPYDLTNDQLSALDNCRTQLNTAEPMNMLLEGDVGAGKTVVAALVMDQVVEAGFQASLMAPTELLAMQHANSIRGLLPDRAITVHTASNKEDIQSADIIIGTHALIQEGIYFPRLALAVIDEQHRFGVRQRKALAEHGHSSTQSYTMPHLLSMTATPIPRSLALTIYGDLQLSIISEKPANRKPIITTIHSQSERSEIVTEVQKRIQNKEQVYIVAPRIASEIEDAEEATDESITMKMPNVEDLERIYKKSLPEARIKALHGKLSAEEKESIMREFSNGEIDALIATTVIEVGVDVANATAIVIEGANRFGLAQLHQLRGRVGRSDKQSYCYIVDADTDEASERLKKFAELQDGFALAEYDLETRGPGSVFGSSQSGFMNQFKMVDFRDADFITSVQQAAAELYGELDKRPLLRKRFEAFSEHVHLE